MSAIDHFIDEILDFSKLSCSRLVGRVEVKTQVFWTDIASHLMNIITEHFFQSALQQMSGRVVGSRFLSSGRVNGFMNQVAFGKDAFFDRNGMQMLPVSCLDAIEHPDSGGRRFDQTGISDLSSGLYIECGFIKDDLTFAFKRINAVSILE